MTQALIETLIREAEKETCYEECRGDGFGYSPGESHNFGDAHEDGYKAGRISMAREILDAMKVGYKKP